MFTVYSSGQKITDNPISYNHLLGLLELVDIPWNIVSSLPLGKSFIYDHIIIVRET